MDETLKTEPQPAAGPDRRKKRGRGALWAFIAVVIAFGAGFLWQYFEASRVRSELADTEQLLRVERLRVQLARAAIAAQAGEYEAARRQMSTLFEALDNEAPTLPENVQRGAERLLSMRDDIITGLSRANPEMARVLFRMLDRLETAAEATPPAPARTQPAAGSTAAPAPANAEPGGVRNDTGGG